MHVSLIVPVYKNRATLRPLCTALAETLTAGDTDAYEIILVDDASPDGAWEEIKNLATDPHITGLRHAKNEGQHAAVITGLRTAKGEWLIALDGDLQDPPEAVAKMLAVAQPSVDVVFAARGGMYQSLPRMVTSKLYRIALALLLPLPKHAGMFFALRRERLERVLAVPAYGASFVARMGLAKLSYANIKVMRAKRSVGSSAYTSFGRIKVFFYFMRAVAANRFGFGHAAPIYKVSETTR